MHVAPKKRKTSHNYDEQVRQALLLVWYAANQICSKRLVPFLPHLVEAMERHGHLRLPVDDGCDYSKLAPPLLTGC